MTYTEPPKLFAIAGKDEKNGEVIVKVVNASSEPIETNITLSGLQKIASTSELITLKAKTGEEENSFESPKKTIPVKENISGISADFKRVFPPFSLSVLRVKSE